jgi:hypothetical protein
MTATDIMRSKDNGDEDPIDVPHINLLSVNEFQPLTTESRTTTTASQPDRTLLSLPAELRNRIYTLTLVGTTPIKVRTHAFVPAYQKHVEPGLFRTCQQIRTEGLRMYYQDNVFELRCTVWINPSLMELESKVHMMRVIRVYVDGMCSHDGRYFEMDTREIPGNRLALIKYTGSVWEKGNDLGCSKGAALACAQEYLNGCGAQQSEMDGVTADILQHLLKILTGCDER